MVDEALKEVAAKALGESGVDSSDEQSLISLIDAGEHLKLVYYATLLLRDVGTAAAIPCLKKALAYPKQDIKIAALCTIADIAKESESDFYREKLTDGSFREKWAALYSLERYGDASAIGSVGDRLKKLLRKTHRNEWGCNTEIVLATKYLARFSTNPDATVCLSLVSEKWETLKPPEQDALKDIIARSSAKSGDKSA